MMTSDAIDVTEHFTRQWEKALPAIQGYVSALVPECADAQDLIQRVAIVASRKFSQFDSSRSFTRWALGIARLEILQHQRTQARSLIRVAEPLDAAIAAVSEEISEELEWRMRYLAECVGELDGRAASLIRFRYEDSLSLAEVADRASMAVGAVRVALTRIRAALRKCIALKLKQTQA